MSPPFLLISANRLAWAALTPPPSLVSVGGTTAGGGGGGGAPPDGGGGGGPPEAGVELGVTDKGSTPYGQEYKEKQKLLHILKILYIAKYLRGKNRKWGRNFHKKIFTIKIASLVIIVFLLFSNILLYFDCFVHSNKYLLSIFIDCLPFQNDGTVH